MDYLSLKPYQQGKRNSCAEPPSMMARYGMRSPHDIFVLVSQENDNNVATERSGK